MKLSVIVVTFNPGSKLKTTIESILQQTSSDFEIVLKDGGTSDGSLDWVKSLNDSRIRIFETPDEGIYDAMNQAVSFSTGDYVIFMNSGDKFYSTDVIDKVMAKRLPVSGVIAYGDTFFEVSDSLSKAPKVITGSVCYRNIPCHQAIFYSRDTLQDRGFDISYKIRADFEHFMWAYYNDKCKFIYLDMPICSYEGGGFSESKENRKKDKDEYNRAVRTHIPLKERIIYRAYLILTFYRLRGVLARNSKTAKIYQKIKGIVQ